VACFTASFSSPRAINRNTLTDSSSSPALPNNPVLSFVNEGASIGKVYNKRVSGWLFSLFALNVGLHCAISTE
jgi:hypothetical protein